MSAATQMFPALDSATEAALRASIERFGVLVPVVKDQEGRILDGHHRVRLAEEIGIEYPETIREVADEAEGREIARTLNADRRHLTAEQRREIVAALAAELSEDGSRAHSQRAIAGALGVSKRTVAKDIAEVGTGTHLPDDVVIGIDGKHHPATKPKKAIYYGRGDKFWDATKPLRTYTKSWKPERLANLSPDEARKRLAVIETLEQKLAEIREALTLRSMRADGVTSLNRRS